ncbi:MAG: TAXI family TRAP transporter solute-binding subunit [Parvibaculum sp.]|uniref:TAXI family TRAP transporter solute-binding subunit n=1 Tax=Parvibaculum sp. TaxID=2024848 RepID=UPI0025D1E373|nr:TAXI family TRAP transporter solute-binding subunit [Parvibaculum sp.]MCE9650610.1 TAXI family TRAP transporter solute-binding subunit [Parvibaculum sp.]
MDLERWKRLQETWQPRLRDAAAHPLARWVLGGVAAGLVAGVLVLVYWRAPASLEEESSRITFFQIGAGASDGPYFAIGGRLSAIVSRPPDAGRCEPGGPCGVEGVLAVVKSSAGSVANVRAVSAGHYESALIQSTTLDQAFRARGAFRGEKPFENLRAIASIYRETVHLVASRGAGIAGVADLKNKRLSVGPKGLGTDGMAGDILRAYGVSSRSLDISHDEPARAAEKLLRGQLDAFFFVAREPSPFLADLANRGTIDIVPISGEEAAALVAAHREFMPMHIAEGVYRFNPALDTLAVSTVWVCNASADEALIHDIAAALFYQGNRELLPASADLPQAANKRDRPAEEAVRLELMRAATQNLVIPLHPGAERFYREENALPEEAEKPEEKATP